MKQYSLLIGIVFSLIFCVGCGSTSIDVTPQAPPQTTPKTLPPTSVMLSASGSTLGSTMQSHIDVPVGEEVILTIIPDHSLVPFQTYMMGIYAHDPYPFSELLDCKYPHTDTCSYTIANSSSEMTDYTKGTHTFTAFLGDIGGSIGPTSNDITITWS